MAQYPITGTKFTENGTGVALSTLIVIKVNGNPVGALQNLSIDESRNIETFDEIGTDGHIDSSPTRSTDVSGSADRIRFHGLRIAEAFDRGFVHVKSQRFPFDIEIIDLVNGGEKDKQIITVIKNVWIEKIGYGFKSDGWVISDNMSWKAETIQSRIGNSAVAYGGSRNNAGFFRDPIEAAADFGSRRGSMDAPGILSSTLSSVIEL